MLYLIVTTNVITFKTCSDVQMKQYTRNYTQTKV